VWGRALKETFLVLCSIARVKDASVADYFEFIFLMSKVYSKSAKGRNPYYFELSSGIHSMEYKLD